MFSLKTKLIVLLAGVTVVGLGVYHEDLEDYCELAFSSERRVPLWECNDAQLKWEIQSQRSGMVFVILHHKGPMDRKQERILSCLFAKHKGEIVVLEVTDMDECPNSPSYIEVCCVHQNKDGLTRFAFDGKQGYVGLQKLRRMISRVQSEAVFFVTEYEKYSPGEVPGWEYFRFGCRNFPIKTAVGTVVEIDQHDKGEQQLTKIRLAGDDRWFSLTPDTRGALKVGTVVQMLFPAYADEGLPITTLRFEVIADLKTRSKPR